MPRYFFDILDGELVIDDIGTVLPGTTEAREEAIAALAAMARDSLPADGPEHEMQCNVRDENGKHLLRVTIKFSVEPPA